MLSPQNQKQVRVCCKMSGVNTLLKYFNKTPNEKKKVKGDSVQSNIDKGTKTK